jgi:hypothetical protein
MGGHVGRTVGGGVVQRLVLTRVADTQRGKERCKGGGKAVTD